MISTKTFWVCVVFCWYRFLSKKIMLDVALADNNDKPPLNEPSPPTYLEMTNVIANKYAKLVEVSIEFLSLGEIDTMSERYEAEVRIRSRWYDDEEIDEYDKTRHWYPKLFKCAFRKLHFLSWKLCFAFLFYFPEFE